MFIDTTYVEKRVGLKVKAGCHLAWKQNVYRVYKREKVGRNTDRYAQTVRSSDRKIRVETISLTVVS